MEIYNDIFSWEGWGGAFRLGSGHCRLRIYDLKKSSRSGISFLKNVWVVASDLPRESPGDMSVRSCNGHIATCVAREFRIDPQRMQFIEYYPRTTYGVREENVIPERMEAVDFTWHEDRAMRPVYRPLDPSEQDLLHRLLDKES